MRNKALFVLAALFPLPLASCGDLPNAPVRDASSATPLRECYERADGTVECRLVVVTPLPGGECDPYHYDCGGDDCITAADPGCGGGGSGGTTPPPGDGSGGGGSGDGGTAPGPSPTCADPLPYDLDGDCDTWDEGPGLWIACVSAVLGTTFGGGATYFAMEDYYHKVAMYNAARIRYEYSRARYGDANPDTARLYTEMLDADREARNAAGIAAMTAGLSLTSLITAGLVCAPLIFAPTP